MNNISCGVIKDLLPSYIEDICTSDSKELVENHCKDCESCQNLMIQMKNNEITSDNIDNKFIDYMKKIKKENIKKELTVLGLVYITLLALVAITPISLSELPDLFFYVALPVFVLVTYFILHNNTPNYNKSKWKISMSIVSLIFIVYSNALMFLLPYLFTKNAPLFGIDHSKFGPPMVAQFFAIIIFLFIIFLCSIFFTVRTASSHGILFILCGTGIFQNALFISLLGRLSSVEALTKTLCKNLTVFLSESILMIILVIVLDKWQKNHLKMINE